MTLTARLQQTGPIPLDAHIQCGAAELLALVGPSGAGKSTILRAIAGLTQVEHGSVVVGGECWQDTATGVWLEPRVRHVGIVFQSYALFPHLSVLENIAEGVHQLPKAERHRRAAEALIRVNLGGFEKRRPAQLSGGQQQRVALARALVREPKALLLDEPFAAVDQTTRERLYQELVELRAGLQIPVVFVTHSLVEAQLLADRMVVLHRGKTLQEGPPHHVMAHPINEEVARLVGFGNLFDTEVVRSDPSAQVTWVKWTPDIALAVNTPRSFACGERVKMGIASGDVAVIKDGRTPQDKGQAIRVVLERATVLGESVHLTLSSVDRSPRLKAVVTKRFFERAQLASGMPLEVELPRDRLLLL